MTHLWQFVHDPVLRAPTLGSMLMCIAASLVGVVAFLRRRSLIGESLSHASFPGVVLGAMIAPFLPIGPEGGFPFWALFGGFTSALVGVYSIDFLEKKAKVSQDSALCLVLSAFFGIGVTLSSVIQFSHSNLYRHVLAFIYGQSVTMQDQAIYTYLVLSLVVIAVLMLYYHEVQLLCFDTSYAKSLGVSARRLDFLLFLLIAFAVVIGIRSVGIVLMAAMLIAPAAAARQLTDKLGWMFVWAAFFGLLSGLLGNWLSLEWSLAYSTSEARLSFPTGPLIVLVACLFAFLAFLFAPKRGRVIRLLRILCFRLRCLEENLLKGVWRLLESSNSVSFQALTQFVGIRRPVSLFFLYKLRLEGWVYVEKDGIMLTAEGKRRAEKIVRLHRLWELYLVHSLHMGVERVHKSAEEMEHILTPELEQQLVDYLHNPKVDPHNKPIPPKKGGFS